MRQFARLRGPARVTSRPGPVLLSLHRPSLIVLLLKARSTPSPGPPRGMSLCHLASRPRADLENFLFVSWSREWGGVEDAIPEITSSS